MITILDLNFLDRLRSIAAFAVRDEAGYTLVECGPFSTHDNLLAALSSAGISPDEVHSLLLTHIHFDHAGAAWWWAARGVQVYVHPRGYRHMVDPARLYGSAKQIYGDRMEELWGEMRGIDEGQITQVADREELTIGGRKWTSHHTPGHASHHIAWQLDDIVFTGDVGGCRIADGPVVPPCPPPDIDRAAWQSSIERLHSLKAKTFYLTHYGKVNDLDHHLDELATRLQKYFDWIEPYYRNGTAAATVVPLFQQYVTQELTEAGVEKRDLHSYLAANPPGMSVAGMLRALQKEDESA